MNSQILWLDRWRWCWTIACSENLSEQLGHKVKARRCLQKQGCQRRGMLKKSALNWMMVKLLLTLLRAILCSDKNRTWVERGSSENKRCKKEVVNVEPSFIFFKVCLWRGVLHWMVRGKWSSLSSDWIHILGCWFLFLNTLSTWHFNIAFSLNLLVVTIQMFPKGPLCR